MMETVIQSKTKRNISKFIVVTLQINYYKFDCQLVQYSAVQTLTAPINSLAHKQLNSAHKQLGSAYKQLRPQTT